MATNIMDLPEHLLGDITLRVARACVLDALSLGMVEAFKEQYATPTVLRECSLKNLLLYPFFEDPEEEVGFRRFMKKLRGMGNAAALYRRGLEQFFDGSPEKRAKGVGELTRAADRGCRKAKYIVGIVLVCEDRPRITEGYGILVGLMRPRLSQTVAEVRVMKMTLRDQVIGRSGLIVMELFSKYVHGPCECGDSVTETLEYLNLVYGWKDDWALVDDGDVEEFPPICLTCFWHREIVLLLCKNPEAVDRRIGNDI